MKTYIVFFGKSQDFTAYYFDRNGYVSDFDNIINNFDKLESKIFTVDDVSNKEILSRYNFVSKKGTTFCLLKLYSFAQALNGSRISGSIYGVGILSDLQIELSPNNLGLIRAAKDNFAKLSLNGLKFNKSDFKEDVIRIWKAIVNSDQGNIFDLIDLSTINFNKSRTPVAFKVENLFENANELNSRINKQDIVYFSEDLEHLKRTQVKWGSDSFPIYWKVNDKYLIYEEPEPEPIPQFNTINTVNSSEMTNFNSSKEELNKEKFLLSDVKYEYDQLKKESIIIKKKLSQQINIFFGLFVLFFLISLAFFFRSIFFDIGKDDKSNTKSNNQVEISKSTPTNRIINLDEIFSSSDNSIDTLIVFAQDAKYINEFKPLAQITDSLKFFNTFNLLKSKAVKLNIDISILQEMYISKIKTLDSLSKTTVK